MAFRSNPQSGSSCRSCEFNRPRADVQYKPPRARRLSICRSASRAFVLKAEALPHCTDC